MTQQSVAEHVGAILTVRLRTWSVAGQTSGEGSPNDAPHDSKELWGAFRFFQKEVLCGDGLHLLVKSLPTPLATNRLLRAPLFHVARIVRRREGEFALEGRVWISSLLLVFDLEYLRGSYVSCAVLLINMIVVLPWRSWLSTKCQALTCTDSNSGLRREFWMDLTASSAVNFPITSASLRLVVVWMGVRSIRCTYSGAWVPPRFTFTTNLMFIMIVSCPLGVRNKREAR